MREVQAILLYGTGCCYLMVNAQADAHADPKVLVYTGAALPSAGDGQ